MKKEKKFVLNRRAVRMVAVNMIYALLVNQVNVHDYWIDLTQYAKTYKPETEEEDYYLVYLQKIVEAGKENENYLFLYSLYHQALAHKAEIVEIISQFLENWDWSRINKVEQVLMLLCVTEWLYFPDIPAKVSLNEYMEIAKIYANPDESHKFINGILDKILVYLRKTKQTLK